MSLSAVIPATTSPIIISPFALASCENCLKPSKRHEKTLQQIQTPPRQPICRFFYLIVGISRAVKTKLVASRKAIHLSNMATSPSHLPSSDRASCLRPLRRTKS